MATGRAHEVWAIKKTSQIRQTHAEKFGPGTLAAQAENLVERKRDGGYKEGKTDCETRHKEEGSKEEGEIALRPMVEGYLYRGREGC